MTTAEREVLLEALRAATVAMQAAMRLLESPAAAPVPVESDADRQRRLKADRQRRWRASKVASTAASQASTGPSTVASTPSTETSTPASTQDQVSPSRACARSSSEIQKEEEKNKEQEPVGLAARQDVRDVTETVASTPVPVASRKRSPNAVLDPSAVPEPVRRVWEAYRKAVGTRVTLTVSRMALIQQRLSEGWSAEDLEACMAGYATSKWHFGENDRGQRYTDIELWLRDTRRIEQGLGMKARPNARSSAVPPAKTPLNGIEAKFDAYFAAHPDGAWSFDGGVK